MALVNFMIKPEIHIDGLVNSFIKPFKKDRFRTLIKSEKGRGKLFHNFYHMKDFDERYVIKIPPVNQNASDVYKMLLNYGAMKIAL